MQYPLSKTVFTVIQIITQYYHVYCENSFSPKYAHLWLTITDYVLIGGALGATIKFIQRMGKGKAIAKEHKGRAKVFSFIGILIFQILQGVSAATKAMCLAGLEGLTLHSSSSTS